MMYFDQIHPYNYFHEEEGDHFKALQENCPLFINSLTGLFAYPMPISPSLAWKKGGLLDWFSFPAEVKR
jgi:hypothetical protein